MRWEKVEVKGEGPGKRWGHTCNAVRDGSNLYLFGGYGKLNCQTNQVHVFDTLRRKWSQPAIKGIPPIARDSHSCTVVDDNLFVFGGTDGSKLLNDLHILDTASDKWILPIVGGQKPGAREGHGAALVGNQLFVFGGSGKSANNILEVYYNDLYILNTATYLWSRAKTSGTPPSPRDCHTCSSWKNKIIVIGGSEYEKDSYLSDVHILDTDTLIWSKLHTSGQSLPPRAGHSAVSFGKKLFVFGGFTNGQSLCNDLYMLDIEACVWTKVATTPNSPPARFYVAGDCLDPCMSGVLVFFGGCNRNLESLDDMHYLYTGIAKESEQRPEKLSLRKQLKLKCREQNPNLDQNPVLCGYGVFSGHMQLWKYNQQSGLYLLVDYPLPPGTRISGNVTGIVLNGYTFLAFIYEKLHQGLLVIDDPRILKPVLNTSTRQICSPDSTGIHSRNVMTSKVLRQNRMEDKQELRGESSESHERQKEADTIVGLSILTMAAGFFKVSFSLNRNGDVQINVPFANYEIPRQVSDAPNSNADVSDESVGYPPNQGETEDCTTPRTEGHSVNKQS